MLMPRWTPHLRRSPVPCDQREAAANRQSLGGSAGDYCVLRLLPPVFFDNAYVVS